MLYQPLPDPTAERRHAHDRWHPEHETIELAAAGAARALGPDHSATRAFARAAATMDKADLWKARLAVKTLRQDQREAIAEVGEG